MEDSHTIRVTVEKIDDGGNVVNTNVFEDGGVALIIFDKQNTMLTKVRIAGKIGFEGFCYAVGKVLHSGGYDSRIVKQVSVYIKNSIYEINKLSEKMEVTGEDTKDE